MVSAAALDSPSDTAASRASTSLIASTRSHAMGPGKRPARRSA